MQVEYGLIERESLENPTFFKKVVRFAEFRLSETPCSGSEVTSGRRIGE